MTGLCRGAGVWAAERYQLRYACNPGVCHRKGKCFISSLIENNTVYPLIPGLFLLPGSVKLQPFPGSEIDAVLCPLLVLFQLSRFHLPDNKRRNPKSEYGVWDGKSTENPSWLFGRKYKKLGVLKGLDL